MYSIAGQYAVKVKEGVANKMKTLELISLAQLHADKLLQLLIQILTASLLCSLAHIYSQFKIYTLVIIVCNFARDLCPFIMIP